MKILILAIVIFCTGNFEFTSLNKTNSQFKTATTFTNSDTTFPIKTINDFVKKRGFKGVIIFNNKKIDPDDPFLFKPVEKKFITAITILNRVPMDSVIKYGEDAHYGMLIIGSK